LTINSKFATIRSCVKANRPLLVAALLLIASHRLPAPIVEESPTPKTEQSAKPKHKEVGKNSDASTKRKAQETPKIDQSTNCKKLDGKWTGTLNCGQFGAVRFTDVISDSGTSVESSASNRDTTYVFAATCTGKMIICNWTIGSNSGTTTGTLNPDGRTAIIHEKANGDRSGLGAYDATGIFYKVSR
jgi:hypothetical protein